MPNSTPALAGLYAVILCLEVRDKMIQMSQEFFDEKIRWKQWKKMTKDYFKNVEKFSRYKIQSGILDLNKGPIAHPEDVE